MMRSQMAFARGACGGLARIVMPSAWNAASKESVNWPAVPDQELDGRRERAEAHQEVTGCLRRPGAVKVRGDAG